MFLPARLCEQIRFSSNYETTRGKKKTMKFFLHLIRSSRVYCNNSRTQSLNTKTWKSVVRRVRILQSDSRYACVPARPAPSIRHRRRSSHARARVTNGCWNNTRMKIIRTRVVYFIFSIGFVNFVRSTKSQTYEIKYACCVPIRVCIIFFIDASVC